jgi:hypothetical protein
MEGEREHASLKGSGHGSCSTHTCSHSHHREQSCGQGSVCTMSQPKAFSPSSPTPLGLGSLLFHCPCHQTSGSSMRVGRGSGKDGGCLHSAPN